LHSWQSSYAGATALSIVLGAVMFKLRPYLDVFLEEMGIRQSFSVKKVFLAAFAGTFLHVTIDAFHHPYMPTFLPFEARPLYGLFSTFEVRAFTFACLVMSFPVYLWVIRDELDVELPFT
ncbi:MAG: hypothetical protein ABEK04_06125, partial [Candidatus Nanohalobium sp.]